MMATNVAQYSAVASLAPNPMRIDPLCVYRAAMEGDLLDEHGQLLDWLIGFAFDTLDALCLGIQVVHVDTRPHAPK
jgi:adenine-specific DNA methylase